MAALEEAGELAAADLSKRVEELAIRIPMNEGKAYAATHRRGPTRAAPAGRRGPVVRGRTTGGWTSSRHLWTPLERWLGAPIPDLPVEEARAALVRAWLDRFGPGDRRGHQVVDGLDARPHPRGGGRARRRAGRPRRPGGLVLAGDTESPPTSSRSSRCCRARPHHDGVEAARLVPRRPQGAGLRHRTGNGGPTVWVDGRIVGGWAQRKTGEVVFRLLEDIGAERSRRGGASGPPTSSGSWARPGWWCGSPARSTGSSSRD